MSPYKIVYRGGEGEIEEKKSRFIAHVHPVSDEKEALDILAKTRKQYWDARHNCFAYTIGKKFELQRYSDDGEPGGTAGRPILDILLKQEIHDCLIVVTRYFGGTLLGTGGLVRAYQKAALEGLANSTVIEKREGVCLTVITDYGAIGKLQYLTARDQLAVTDTRYGGQVETDVVVPSEKLDAFKAGVTEISGGKALIRERKKAEFAVVGGEVLIF